MRAHRNIHTTFSLPKRVEFYHEGLDSHFRIENHPAKVVIRTDRLNLSGSARERFLHHLATEGFIADCNSCSIFDQPEHGGISIQWIEDASWVDLSQRLVRLKARLLRPFLATNCLVILIGLSLLFLRTLFSVSGGPH